MYEYKLYFQIILQVLTTVDKGEKYVLIPISCYIIFYKEKQMNEVTLEIMLIIMKP